MRFYVGFLHHNDIIILQRFSIITELPALNGPLISSSLAPFEYLFLLAFKSRWSGEVKYLNLLLNFSLNLFSSLAIDFLATHSTSGFLFLQQGVCLENFQLDVLSVQHLNQSNRHKFPTTIRLDKIWSPFRSSGSMILLRFSQNNIDENSNL